MQLKSKQRVSDFGEVFTSEREVNAMLDLVKQETERVDSRFLEPACGTGNFLAEVLNRKIAVVNERYSAAQNDWEFNALIAVGSIYGIDIQADNVRECRTRLFNKLSNSYQKQFSAKCTAAYLDVIRFVFDKNILWGDALSLRTPEEDHTPIVFSEWSPVNGSTIKRRDFTMANLLENQPMDEPNLFSDLGDQAFLPTPVAEFPVCHYLKLGENA